MIEEVLPAGLVERIEARSELGEPMCFGDSGAESRILHEGLGLALRPDRSALLLRGPDARRFLQGQITNDVLGLGVGESCYAYHLSPKGRILADLRAIALADEELELDLPSSGLDQLQARLERSLVVSDAEISRPVGRGALLLAGPNLLGALSALALPTPTTGASQSASFAEGELVLRGTADYGTDAVEVWGNQSELRSLVLRLLEGGAEPIGADALRDARIEAGCPRFGVDFGEDNTPAELGRDDAVSYTKGCYVGQEVVARMKAYGDAPKRLVGLSADRSIPEGAPLHAVDDSAELGRVSSSGRGPRVGAPIALAYLRKAHPGTGELIAGSGDEEVRVRVQALPFI